MKPNDRPWMTALEMKFVAMAFGRRAMMSGSQTLAADGKLRAMLAQGEVYLGAAETYAWSHDTTNAVMVAAKTIPSDVVLSPEMLPPSAYSWWWFDKGTPFIATFQGEDFSPIMGLLLRKGEDKDGQSGVFVTTYGMREVPPKPNSPFPSTRWMWRFGESLHSVMARHPSQHPTHGGSDQTEVHVRHLGRFLIAALTWINQRILSMGSGPVERHRRKQLAREHDVPLPSDVKVIQLRRTESQSQTPARRPNGPAAGS